MTTNIRLLIITNGVKPGTITNGELPWVDDDYGF